MHPPKTASPTPTNDGRAPASSDASATSHPNDFIRAIVAEDVRTGKHGGRVLTRFPPEPNGYLHIGHAKSICLNFGIAQEHNARCNLRFDDTNPTAEDIEYAHAIERDVRWLGFDFGEKPLHASDYFEQLYQLAVGLIERGRAYVCSLNEEQIREYRGSLTVPGRESPYRSRSVAENLDLFARMRAGEFGDGAHVLRARIDMAATNMKMRDPLLYRIRHATHHRTGDAWCIYPMYDYAHPLSDSIEGITHSICTLEFENNRELYDWVIEATEVPSVPRQYEFARLNLEYTLLSKRKLLQLVEGHHVAGWDDPRLPTLAGMRRRGYTPEAIRAFCELIGVSKHNSVVDIGKLEYCLRDDMNHFAPRVMCVVKPLRVVLTNYPAGEVEQLDAPYFPADVGKPGSRTVPFSGEIFLEQADFEENPPADYHRLAPGRVVRLRHAYCIRCDEVVKDPATGAVTELRCSYIPGTLGGKNPGGEKVWGALHWVSAPQSLPVELRLYDRLFRVARPDAAGEDEDFTTLLNPESLQVVHGSRIEPSVADAAVGSRYQFERQGYFCIDSVDSKAGALVFNRTVTLRDTWATAAARPSQPTPAVAAKQPAEKTATDAKGKPRPARRTRADVRTDARASDPNLAARFERFQSELKVTTDEADLLTADAATADLFEAAIAVHAKPASVARWIINELPRELGERSVAELPFSGAQLGALVAMADTGNMSGPVGKQVLGVMMASGGDPAAIVERLGLSEQSGAAEIDALVSKVLADNPDKVTQYLAGKTGLLGFFVGQVVKASRGKANPQDAQKVLEAGLAQRRG